ncbi:MAG TPA: alpha/beta hydrolase [Gemmatimonadaceae bacterium]
MLLIVVLIVAAVYVLVVALLWLNQERIAFQPPPVSDIAARRAGGERVRQVSYRADDGTELFAFVVGELDRSDRLLIAFHGNADLARLLIPWAQTASRTAGIAVLLPELRGYDGLVGRPTYTNAARDARAARLFVRQELSISDTRVAYFGHSLGSAIATELAAESSPNALVLQSPFTSARDMARRMAVPGLSLFWPLVSRVHYDTESRVRELLTPVSVAHGLRDLIVSARMGQKVYEAAAVKGRLLLVSNAGHNDIAERAPTEYWKWFQAALDLGRARSTGQDARTRS